MNKVCFTGRKYGAIGVTYPMVAEVLNDPHEDIEACRLELYDLGFESITNLRALIEHDGFSSMIEVEPESWE